MRLDDAGQRRTPTGFLAAAFGVRLGGVAYLAIRTASGDSRSSLSFNSCTAIARERGARPSNAISVDR